ncbi:MAG: transposase [Desulfomonile tiedjei]|nr:transposase [Desulfomonile tiedjei]
MPNYRRQYFGTAWFFTVVTFRRSPLFGNETARACLLEAVDYCRERYPFVIGGWVLLPDHMHCIWHLEDRDTDFSRRWSIIKRKFTKAFRERGNQEPPFWQKRFWEHCIRDERDYENHLNYIHFNPVKHGYVRCPNEWQWTSFHSYVEKGVYLADWGSCVEIPLDIGNE